MFKDLLEYQKLDAELIKLKNDIEQNPTKLLQEKSAKLGKDEQNNLLVLDARAKTLIEDYEKGKKEYEEACKKINALSKNGGETEEKISQTVKELNELFPLLTSLKDALDKQIKLVSEILTSFDNCKSNIVTYRNKYNSCKEEVEKYEATILPRIEDVKKRMSNIEKLIDKDMLAKYKHLRQDRIFPVLVSLNQNSCGGCSMSLSSAQINKIKTNGYIQCENENCRRYILNK